MTQKLKDIRRLGAAGVDISCRCPKPCVRHSDHYREEALRELSYATRQRSKTTNSPEKGMLTLVLRPDDADEIASALAACSDDYESLTPYMQRMYDKLRSFAG